MCFERDIKQKLKYNLAIIDAYFIQDKNRLCSSITYVIDYIEYVIKLIRLRNNCECIFSGNLAIQKIMWYYLNDMSELDNILTEKGVCNEYIYEIMERIIKIRKFINSDQYFNDIFPMY